MKAPAVSDVVVSRAGHDRGCLYIVTGTQSGRLLLCDGRLRKLENPKRKSPRHVRLVSEGTLPDTDKEIRRTLTEAAQAAAAKEESLLGER